eukprot:gb/GECG01007815.1/.p1 GENE.gb/GECG01007815.1/~~gb/GECG01007815.1/.p1  ORF type:complete len:162 (+),score=13.72 gb/GECG01007815.1/:1-486(+)
MPLRALWDRVEDDDEEEDPFKDPVLEDEDLDELDDMDDFKGRNDGAPPMFMSVGATLSCAGGIYVAHMARHGVIGTSFAAAGTVGFFLSTYHFNRVHKDKQLKEKDIYIGHVEGFGTGVLLSAGQAYLYSKGYPNRWGLVHLGMIGFASLLYHGGRLMSYL